MCNLKAIAPHAIAMTCISQMKSHIGVHVWFAVCDCGFMLYSYSPRLTGILANYTVFARGRYAAWIQEISCFIVFLFYFFFF